MAQAFEEKCTPAAGRISPEEYLTSTAIIGKDCGITPGHDFCILLADRIVLLLGHVAREDELHAASAFALRHMRSRNACGEFCDERLSTC